MHELEFENVMQQERDTEFTMCEEEFQSFVGNYPDFDKMMALDEQMDNLDLLMQEGLAESQQDELSEMFGLPSDSASILQFSPLN